MPNWILRTSIKIQNEIGKALHASELPNLDFVDLSGIFDYAEETTFPELVYTNHDANTELALKLFESLKTLIARQ